MIPMRIVLDARKYYDFGIGTYIQNLVAHLESRCDLVLLVAPDDMHRIDQHCLARKRVNTSKKYSIRELHSIAADANKLHAHVFHAPHYTTPFGLKMPCVTTVHDILHVKGNGHYSFPKRVYAQAIIAHACNVSQAVIVDSEFTKRELMESFTITDERIHVVPLGVSSMFFKKYPAKEVQRFRNKYGLVKPTILYTGSLKPHKNVELLISAFSNMRHRSDFQLAFSGEYIKKHHELWNVIKQKGLTGDVVEIGQVTTSELALAYRASAVVVLPSLYEGFGFSMVEAMASGIPAIGARAGSIPEVVGNGGLLFDPHSAEDLTCTLENVLDDTLLRKKLVLRGLRNVKRFSWEKCAEQTFQIYKDVR
ncbi:MAG: glycosyltransferase family 1 protein [Ignavibacteriae bacterium]|nr:MAG: glycosyltransferase family 1 protein [Ignavibacteriota bacterium]